MSALSRAAHQWLTTHTAPEGATATPVDLASGIAASRRTGVGHYVADAAEISVDGDTALAAVWLCGGSTIDGYTIEETTPDCVTCRIAAVVPSTPCVYYAWGKDDELLYVGSTINAPQRIRAHVRGTAWWSDVRRLTFDEHPTEHAARRAEFVAISAGPGVHNIDGRRRPSNSPDLLRLVVGEEDSA
jgi:hypothetical protein